MAAKHELYVIRGKTLDTIADNVRTVLGIDPDEPIRFDETTLNNTTQANGDIDAQADLIAQIQTALEGKAAGNGSEIIAEIASLIDQSGVLDSTEGTVEDKVGVLISLADVTKRSRLVTFENDKTITSIDVYLGAPYGTLNNTFNGTTNLKTMVGVNTSKCNGFNNTFRDSGIETIIEPFDFSSATGGAYFHPFNFAEALINIRFVSETIHCNIVFGSFVLSSESIRSIFGGLNSDITGKSLTLKRVAVKKAFETSEGSNDGDTSETWNALVASKPNWTITLS